MALDAATTLAFALAGVSLGVVSGLTPGLHANNFALMLASFAPALPGSPLAVGVAMLAAGVVHTFLDVVPALALGVPDAAMAASALPGHRLVLAGRGREALYLSALGSGLAVLLAVPLAIPLTRAMEVAYPTLRAWLPALLAGVVVALAVTESSVRAAVAGLAVFALAAVLGAVSLDVSPSAPLSAGGILAPLFGGLFGAPVLLDAVGGSGVPAQEDADVTLRPASVATTAAAGAGAGALVGYLPGVSAAIGAVLSLPFVPGRTGARGFLVATSGANTANTVFALFALVALGMPRTGVMVALDRARVPLSLPTLLTAVALAASLGFVLVLTIGDYYLRTVGRVDPDVLSYATLCGLVVVSYLFAGGVGVLVFGVATCLGLVPPRVGTRRVHLMGVLYPAILFP
ncbi:tripartite tricarboxylate transporter permease [Haloplanus sp. GCM10025708]|uniref:tripartite tricarboxylate transporter permease n=1 Tax=Haloferacaceae TaxID=1644056 RepID=UPI00360DCC08